jgi:hypothetical protein
MIASALTTAIFVVAALLGIIGALLTIYVFISKRQYGRPVLQLLFGWSSPPNDFPRALKKQPVTVLAIAPRTELKEPLLAVLTFRLQNPGKEAITNVRLSIEYGQRYVVSNQLFAALADFKPTVVPDLSTDKTVSVVHPAVSKDELAKALAERVIQTFGGRAQMTIEFPIIRPGEWYLLYDLVLLPGSGPDDLQKLGFGGPGFRHVLEKIRGVSGLLDYFVVNFFVYAENHERLNQKVSVLRFASEAASEKGLQEFAAALWLGQLPKAGVYFSNPILRRLRYRMGHVGRRSRELFRSEVGIIRHSSVVKTETDVGQSYHRELADHSAEEYFTLGVPNCDYFELPEQVDSFESLTKWLGISQEPTF